MAKRRTKKEKIIARLRRQVKFQNPTSPRKIQGYVRGTEKIAKKSKQEKRKKEDIFGYDSTLINKDLRKTALLSVVFTLVILAFWLFST